MLSPRLPALFNEIEMPLIPVLADMEMAGIALDRDFFAAFSMQLKERMQAIEAAHLPGRGGKTFNINSTQQLSDILFGTLRLAPPDRGKKTASGHYSTAAGVLDELSGQHPVVDMVLEYRELSKLKSTYVDTLPLQIHPETGRVHTSFSQTGAVTGRLSSSDPNLQNIPTRTELGRRVRRGFIAGPATCCSRWITRRSSCASLPTWPRMRPCWQPSAPGRISMPPPRQPSTASRLPR